MRKMVFGTFHAGHWVHYLECAHMRESPESFGVTELLVSVWDQQGDLRHWTRIPLDLPLWSLNPPCDPGATYFVTIESTFTPQAIPHIYGYIHSGDRDGDGMAVYYPLNMALGSHHETEWDNVGHFVWGTPSPGHRLRLFIGNPSRWATVSGDLTLFFPDEESRQMEISLGPKRHTLIDLWPEPDRSDFPVPQGMEFISTSKLVTYVIGQQRRTDRFTFIEHLMERRR
jgi:hypothetical protein